MSSYTLYDASIAVVRDALDALSNILTKAEAHPNSASFLDARLAEDMLPFSFQVFFVTDLAQKLAARGTGADPLDLDRTLDSFAAMQARIALVRGVLDKVDREALNARAEAECTVGMGPGKEVKMQVKQYVNGYVLPNVFFHTTTAYAILRKEGVQLGKQDYLESFIGQYLS
ncbi:hypothetical protein AK830_g5466 [Neonectria ditissima]|uniref:DUF1993 domain-containing protein n=1 Tax=Neonectria ditissima TaxID=78410 RepID=A0A0P7BKT1_9HYPO|nr:hypothetical protein AK830_g5466 [Neonectria ditissima]